MNKLQVIDRPHREDYSRTLSLQTNLLEAKVEDRSLNDMLVLVEHDHVFTAGRKQPFQEVVDAEKRDVPWYEVGRGGKVTYHGPGQLVAYPVFDLSQQGKDVHVYLRKLEEAVIHCLAQFGVSATTIKGLTGVWVPVAASASAVKANGGHKKIASIGVGVRKWVSYHGLALNVSTDLSYFKAISACDLDGEVMTSLAEVCHEQGLEVPEMLSVRSALVNSFVEVFELEVDEKRSRKPRPSWLRVKAPGSPQYKETLDIVKRLRLNTVCEEAVCPNIGECWSHHTATFMIMGDLCTRRCGFCAVKDGTLDALQPLDPMEPFRVGNAVRQLGLKHVVITSVNRDDVDDMGASHFDQTVKSIHRLNPDCNIELLIPDMRGRKDWVETILQSGLVSVLNHNVETVPSLYKRVRPGAVFKRSLNVLRWAKEFQPDVKTKSGFMLGLGEPRDEVLELMDHLREAGVSILTIGQYLQPTDKQLPVDRFITPEEFADYKSEGLKRGFSYVESGPLVRSSYHAWQHSSEDPSEKPYEKAAASASMPQLL